MRGKISIITNNSAIRFIREAYKELKKVVWPKRQDVVSMTIAVVVTIVVATILLSFLDLGLANTVKQLLAL